MPKIDVYNIEGKKVNDVELKEDIFGIIPNEELVHSVIVNYLANQRQGTQSTKTRAEVRGGGKKPWRQKGTGRARQGSIRAPHWVGGGIALGPKPRSYSYKLNKKERRLAIKIKNGDIEAKKIFIQNNLRLVVSIAKKYRCKIMSFLDLIQEGNLGLMKALDGYDVSKGYKFSTYATWWIKQSIRLAIIKKGNEIRVPTGVYENVNNYKKKEEELSIILGRDPTDSEMSEFCNIPVSEIQKMKSILLLQNHSTSLNSLVNDETTSTFEDFLPTPDEPIENLASLSMLNAEILTLFDSCNLNKREKEILVLRYGLNGNNPMKLIEVAQEYDLTHERIRQIESNAINKIRNNKKIDDFLIYMSNPKAAKKRLSDFRENYKKDKNLRYKKSI